MKCTTYSAIRWAISQWGRESFQWEERKEISQDMENIATVVIFLSGHPSLQHHFSTSRKYLRPRRRTPGVDSFGRRKWLYFRLDNMICISKCLVKTLLNDINRRYIHIYIGLATQQLPNPVNDACDKGPSVWIGLWDPLQNRQWQWTDGTAVDFFNWYSGEWVCVFVAY